MDDHREYLFEYNNSPLPGLHCSPSQIVNSRVLRSELGVPQETLQPKIQTNIRELLEIKQGTNKEIHDRHRLKKETSYKIGDEIVFKTRNDSHWQKGKIEEKGDEPRAYWISRYGDKYLLRRNTSQMKRSRTDPNFKDSINSLVDLLLFPYSEGHLSSLPTPPSTVHYT